MAQLVEVSVKVIQARHLHVEANASTQVEVSVGEKSKCTKTVKYSDSPFFDQYLTFDYKIALEDVLDKTVHFKVKKHRALLANTTIAEYSIPLREVWFKEGHQIHRQWAPLVHPTILTTESQGFLKVDIRVLKAGELSIMPLQLDPETEDCIEGNLIKRRIKSIATGDRLFAEYIVKVFKADGLPKLPSSCFRGFKRAVGAEGKESLSPQVCIKLSDLEGKTSVQFSKSPIWNECLTFTEVFPPMWSNIRVQLMNYSSLGSTILAEYCIPVSSVSHFSNDETNNFPPTFGPSYVHLYTDDEKYAGRILISVGTNILDSKVLEEPPARAVIVSPCDPYQEKKDKAKLALFTSLLAANMIPADQHDHKLVFQVCFGSPYASQGDIAGTSPMLATKGDEDLCSLPAGEIAPCISTTTTWPNRRHSMFAHNRLNNILKMLDGALKCKDVPKVGKALLELSDLCARVELQIKAPSKNENGTDLDVLKADLCKATLDSIALQAKSLAQSNNLEEQIKAIQEFHAQIQNLILDPQQGGVPNIYVCLTTENGKVLASQSIKPETVIYSLVDSDAGVNCGQPFTIFMQAQGMECGTSVLAKLRLYMWLGLTKEVAACLQRLPAACAWQVETGSLFPASLHFTKQQVFECRAHVYQGSFTAGWDRSGMCDPFVRVSIGNKTSCTEVKTETLSPTWNQTLVLWPVVVWGDGDWIASNPPPVVIEALDTDIGKDPDYIGRIACRPRVKLLSKPSGKRPLLEWFIIQSGTVVLARILAAFELIQRESIEHVPSPSTSIRPSLNLYRLECLFWGIRGNSKVDRPCLKVECSGQEISSTVITNVSSHSNFDKPHQWTVLELPENSSHLPPVTLKLFSHRNYCKPCFEGVCMVPTLQAFLRRSQESFLAIRRALSPDECPLNDGVSADNGCDVSDETVEVESETTPLLEPTKPNKTNRKDSKSSKSLGQNWHNIELDWWSKFFASESKTRHAKLGDDLDLAAVKIKIYDNELEAQPEFNGFRDLVQNFTLVKGHRSMEDEPPEIATFKGGFSLLRIWSSEDAASVPMSILPPTVVTALGDERSTRVLARIYVVKGLRLRPKDVNGLSDPYVTVRTNLGSRIKDRDNYIKANLNPVFGRCYELELSLPREYELVIGVWDRDETSADDFIGETCIDVETRLMSHHRPHCGLSMRYDRCGYNAWRDGELPSQILESLCVQYHIPVPEYNEPELTVGKLTVVGPSNATREQLALAVLHRWKDVAGWSLVPEHVESRPLYLSRKPGVEQGRLVMWLDLFPERGPIPNPEVDIRPRKPVDYELRVIIWNAEEIPLDDSTVAGERMSDIYFKCWLGEPTSMQSTDVHYRSVTGEGQFNWRMLFPLRYLPAERKMIIERKTFGLFSRGEQFLPCVLNVQAWDADVISADDFLGYTTLELCRLVPGAKSANNCKVDKAVDAGPLLNLFISRRTRGWWALRDDHGGPAGKLELELEIVPGEEAQLRPVGRGRDPPKPLPPPKRPDTSFMWLVNPARAARVVLWRRFGKKIFVMICLGMLILSLVFSIIMIPIVLVNKLISFVI